MRITLKKYEKAKEAVAKLKKHEATVKSWEEAVRKVGSTGDMKIVAVEIDDGRVSAECVRDEAKEKPLLKGA